MTNILRAVYSLIPDLVLLSKQHYTRSKKINVAATYLRLFCKQIFLPPKNLLTPDVRENICGFTVHAFDRGAIWFLFREIFIKGEYIFCSNTDSPVIFDCGANIGVSAFFFKWLYPNSTIHAFEPNPQANCVLQKNIADNKLYSVHTYNAALGKKDGVIILYAQPENPAALTVSTLQERKNGKPIEVPLTKLSNHITSRVDFLKIDTEGAETDIIADLCESGAIQHVNEMTIEYHHNIPSRASKFSEILANIEQSGFSYQIHTSFSPLARKNRFQDVMLHCYRNDSVQQTSKKRTSWNAGKNV